MASFEIGMDWPALASCSIEQRNLAKFKHPASAIHTERSTNEGPSTAAREHAGDKKTVLFAFAQDDGVLYLEMYSLPVACGDPDNKVVRATRRIPFRNRH